MKIIYEAKAAEKCRTWAAHAGLDAEGKGSLIEVGGLGTVRIEKPDLFIIDDVFLLEQEGSGAEYLASADAVAAFYNQFITGGGDPATVMHFWHSHADMGVFQSGTDRGNVRATFNKKALCVAVTWNGKGEVYGEVTLFRPIETRFDSVLVEIAQPCNAEYLAELREKVKPRAATVYVGRDRNGRFSGVGGLDDQYEMPEAIMGSVPGYGRKRGYWKNGCFVWEDIEAAPNTRGARGARSHAQANNNGKAMTPSQAAAFVQGPIEDLAVEDIEWTWLQGRWVNMRGRPAFVPIVMNKAERKAQRKSWGARIDIIVAAYSNEDPLEVMYEGETRYLFSYKRQACIGTADQYVTLDKIEEKLAALVMFRKCYKDKLTRKAKLGWNVAEEGRKEDEFPQMLLTARLLRSTGVTAQGMVAGGIAAGHDGDVEAIIEGDEDDRPWWMNMGL